MTFHHHVSRTLVTSVRSVVPVYQMALPAGMYPMKVE